MSSVSASSLSESILVVRLGAMGDVVHALYGVTALRSACPNIRVGWVVEHRWSQLLCADGTPHFGPRTPERPLADFVHTVDTKRWRKSPFSRETRQDVACTRRELREQNYSIAADFQGALKSAILARVAGAKTVLGFAQPREAPARFFYGNKVPPAGAHVIDHYRSLAEAIAAKPLPHCAPLLPRDHESEARIEKWLAAVGSDFAIINPGAGWGAKQWPAERYAKVAQALSYSGVVPVVNFGPGEQELALRVNELSNRLAQPISCSISQLIALTRRARLFIGGDTGPLHLAAALQIPVVAIFGPTDPARNGPYATKSIVLRNPASKTSLSHTSGPDPGLMNITADEVIAAAHQLLENPRG